MATIPPKFIYENAGPYFRGELDTETAKRWEKAVQSELGYYEHKKDNSDWSYAVPFAIGIACGLL